MTALEINKPPALLWDGRRRRDEILRRVQILDKGNRARSDRSALNELCKRNIFFWIENFVWTFDPRLIPHNPLLPFVLFPKQSEYIQWRRKLRRGRLNGVCEKSRDSGMSWLNICDQVHYWLFEDSFKGSFGSRKEDLVDQIGNPDSIFEKIRILLRNLPTWMLPPGFDWDKHDNFKRLINPANGSTITGESGDKCGRGGRSAIYDWDEVAFSAYPHSIEAALSGCTNTIYYTSSANGENFFYQKVCNATPETLFRFHWRDDPRKNDQWYAEQCAKFDAVTVASEIDIDYGASVEGIFIPGELVRAAIDLELPFEGESLAALDVAIGGGNLNVLGMRRGPVVRILDSWDGLDTTQTALKAREIMVKRGLKKLNFDADGVGAGCAGTFNGIPDLEFEAIALHGASTPSKTKWPGEGKTSQQKFYNGRAEWWGLLYDRFKKTYDYVNGQRVYPLDELISIPNDARLIAQISIPKKKYASNGKTLVESKLEMKKRGVSSPDFADMLAYLFAPVYKLHYDPGILGSTASRQPWQKQN